MTTRALSAVCPQAQSRDSGQPLHPPTPPTPVPPPGYRRQDRGLCSWLLWCPGSAAVRTLRLIDTGDRKHIKLAVGFLLFLSRLLGEFKTRLW